MNYIIFKICISACFSCCVNLSQSCHQINQNAKTIKKFDYTHGSTDILNTNVKKLNYHVLAVHVIQQQKLPYANSACNLKTVKNIFVDMTTRNLHNSASRSRQFFGTRGGKLKNRNNPSFPYARLRASSYKYFVSMNSE